MNKVEKRSGKVRRAGEDRRKYNDLDYSDPEKRNKRNRRSGNDRRGS
jgi:hypothetical protein|tara:strand:- start:1710 stop:1850 length:141 start_codon:yes stop_codon:yes gene_type:complete